LRNRRSLGADLKSEEGRQVVRALVPHADVLVEGFRPGTTERMGLGPDDCSALNPALVYARMTGWGQTGPRAHTAGHDINYLAPTGVLHAIGRADEPPLPPLNLVGDFGGGSMLLLVGVLSALYERQESGRGQVVDAAMVDGVALLSQMIWSMRIGGSWRDGRGTNILDTGAPYYDTYRCGDGKFFAVGAIEPQFYAALLHGLGLEPATLPGQNDRSQWPLLRERLAAAFAEQDQSHWTAVFEGTDACASPVLDWEEALGDPHLVARGTFATVGGHAQPAPAPRFSRSVPAAPAPPPSGRLGLEDVLDTWSS
jgi:alpha-methylacyl-CoA racemase